MTVISRNDAQIRCIGHAGDKICCAMLTSLTIVLLKNLEERLNLAINYHLDEGIFELDLHDLPQKAWDLIEAYWFGLQALAESYPDNFSFL